MKGSAVQLAEVIWWIHLKWAKFFWLINSQFTSRSKNIKCQQSLNPANLCFILVLWKFNLFSRPLSVCAFSFGVISKSIDLNEQHSHTSCCIITAFVVLLEPHILLHMNKCVFLACWFTGLIKNSWQWYQPETDASDSEIILLNWMGGKTVW